MVKENIIPGSSTSTKVQNRITGYSITTWTRNYSLGHLVIAADYYCNHFYAIRSVVDSFNSADSASIADGKKLFATLQVRTQLSFISSQFSVIVRAIKMETQGLELSDRLEIVAAVHSGLNRIERKNTHEKWTRFSSEMLAAKHCRKYVTCCNKVNIANTNILKNCLQMNWRCSSIVRLHHVTMNVPFRSTNLFFLINGRILHLII